MSGDFYSFPIPMSRRKTDCANCNLHDPIVETIDRDRKKTIECFFIDSTALFSS